MKSIDGLKSREDKAANKDIRKKVVVKNTTKTVPAEETVKMNKKIDVQEVEDIDIETTQAHEDFANTSSNEFDFDLTSDEMADEVKAAKNNEAKERKVKKKEKKKISKARKIITSILLILVLGIIGVVAYLMVWGSDIVAKITGGEGDVFSALQALTSDELVELKADKNGRTNILVFGTSGYTMEGTEGDGVHDGAALTDSIILLSFDQKTYDLAMVNIPRDLKAGATCTATGKINEVYWCNNMYDEDEEGGAMALVDRVEGVFDVDIQYWAHINWGSLVALVDYLGGIDVVLDEYIDDEELSGAIYEPGVTYHIDGRQALALARARHGTVGGDFSRGNSQQKIIMAIKDKLLENGIGWKKALDLIGFIGDNLRTNVKLEEMRTGLWLLGEMNLDSMRQVPLVDYENNIFYMTTGTIDGISYVLPAAGVDEYYELQAYIREQFTTPEKKEEPAAEEVEESEELEEVEEIEE